jgi:hypothetical protein
MESSGYKERSGSKKKLPCYSSDE